MSDMRVCAMLLGLAPGLVVLPAAAQDRSEQCACIVAPVADPAAAGSVVTANGDVFLAGPDGLLIVGAGAPLPADAQMSTGPLSTASISVGDGCELEIGPSTAVSVLEQADGNLCVRAISDELVTGAIPGPSGGAVAVLLATKAAAISAALGLLHPISN